MPLELLLGFSRYRKNKFANEKDLLNSLSHKQLPLAIFITCCDSRIIPSSFTSSKYGSLLIIKNAGNIVPSFSDYITEAAATIEFGLNGLNIKEIIVCGHADCGAMKGLLNPNLKETLPLTSAFLNKHAKPALERTEKNHPDITDSNLKLKYVTQENILLQLEHIKTHPAVQKKLDLKELTMHAWYYDFQEGEIFIFDQEENKFICFEEAVTKVFSSDSVLSKMNSIVVDEALKHLETLESPQTADAYNKLRELTSVLKFKGVGVIWEFISNAVTKSLWKELGELCDEKKGMQDPRFISLMIKCPNTKLENLTHFEQKIQSSKGYHKVCSSMLNSNYSQPLERNKSPENSSVFSNP